MSVPLAGQLQHGVLDQTAQQGSDRRLPPRVGDVFLSPLPGEDRVSEEHPHGRKHFPQECHSPGHRRVPLLRAELPSRLLDEEHSGGRFRYAWLKSRLVAVAPLMTHVATLKWRPFEICFRGFILNLALLIIQFTLVT